MTYETEVQFKFDATYTRDYNRGFGSNIGDDDFLPEEHFLITAPADDLNAKQYFKLFEKFMLCVGMCPSSIRSGAMSLVFNDWVSEEDQRKVCKEYEITMDEDLNAKFEEWKIHDAEIKADSDDPKEVKLKKKVKKNTDETQSVKEAEVYWSSKALDQLEEIQQREVLGERKIDPVGKEDADVDNDVV